MGEKADGKQHVELLKYGVIDYLHTITMVFYTCSATDSANLKRWKFG